MGDNIATSSHFGREPHQSASRGFTTRDNKSSQPLLQMRALTGPSFGPNGPKLHQFWLQRLPPPVEPLISMLLGELSLDEVADTADTAVGTLFPKLHQATHKHANMPNSINSDNNSTSTLLYQLSRKFMELTTEIRASTNRVRS